MWYGSDAGGRPETIGELLVRVRQEQGISQLRLAERLCASAGVSTVTRNEVSRWERGERIPNPYWLGWLAATLDLPLEQLRHAAEGTRRRRHGRVVLPPDWFEDAEGVYARRVS